jgi:enoyl-CoA hydratase/carnithine racemase
MPTPDTVALDYYRSACPALQFAAPLPGILEIIITNEPHLNAADAAMHRDLAQIWRLLDSDAAIRAVLVRGAGANFCAGGDFALLEEMIADDAALVRVWKEASDLVYNLVNCSKPVVSAIRGTAVGAGLAVALLADIAIAGKSARLMDGHTRLGVAAGDHAVLIWPLLCGLARARYYLLLNEPVSGEVAERIGLVARCVEDEALYATALEITRKLAAGSPTAMQWTKRTLNNWLKLAGPSFDASLALEFLGFRLPDIRAGLAAVKNKRPI